MDSSIEQQIRASQQRQNIPTEDARQVVLKTSRPIDEGDPNYVAPTFKRDEEKEQT